MREERFLHWNRSFFAHRAPTFRHVRSLIRLFITLFTVSFTGGLGFSAQAPRDTLVAAMLADDQARKTELILSLAGVADESIKPVLDAWKEDALFIYQPAEGAA